MISTQPVAATLFGIGERMPFLSDHASVDSLLHAAATFSGSLISPSAFVFNLHAVPPLVTALAIVSLGLIVVFREKASRVSLLYLMYTLAASGWMFSAGIALLMSSEEIAFLWMKFANAGVTMIPASVYHFTVVVLETERRDRWPVRLAWVFSAIFLAITLLTDVLFDGFYHYSWGIFLKFRWPSYLFIAYFFAMTVVTIKAYWTEYQRSDRTGTKRRRAKAFLIAFSIGYLGMLDFLPAVGIPYYPMSSLPMICMLVLVSRAIWRYRLVDITPAFAAQEIMENMNDALLVLDRDNIIRVINRATCELLGFREEDLLGQRPVAGMHSCREFAEQLESIAGNGPVRNRELTCHSGKGLRRSISVSTSIMRNMDGEQIATVCLLSDMTERRRAYEEREGLIVQLREANEKLQSLDKVKTNFITMVSHELRTPLTTIKAFVELLLVKRGMPEVQKVKLMRTVNVEVDRLARLIADLLDLARIESGAMKWNREELAIDQLVHDVITSMTLLFEKKGLRVTTEFEPRLPTLYADRDRLVQVITNILSNAVKFTKPGGSIHVLLKREQADSDLILVEVSDSGLGIQAQDLELIFEKFHRSDDKHASEIEGTGLGLAITREIVERHGGKIWVTSIYGKGSVFTFTLPLGQGNATSAR